MPSRAKRNVRIAGAVLWGIAAISLPLLSLTGVFNDTPSGVSATSRVYKPQLASDGAPAFIPTSVSLATPDPSVTLPNALTYRPSPGSPVVTPSQAEDVVRATWTLHNKALSDPTAREMATFETGLALEVDQGRCACGAASSNPFGAISQLNVSVERQTTYPAEFFAQVGTTASSQPWLAFSVFTRSDSQTSWKLSFIGGMQTAEPANVTPQPLDTDGYATAPLTAGVIDPKAAFSDLAYEWASARNTGKAPTTSMFAPGVWTNQRDATLAQYHQGVKSTNGLVGYYVYEIDPSDLVFDFPQGRGYQIACSAIRVQRTYVGTNAFNGPFQDSARKNWDTSVPPGSHSAIIQTDLSIPCIEIPPANSTQKPDVLGGYEDNYVTGYR